MTPRAFGMILKASLVAEGLTAVALLAVPDVVARLLVGEDLFAGGIAMARLLGLALAALVVACWPGAGAPSGTPAAIRALLAYNLLVAAYLLVLAMSGPPAGILAWPAVVAHAAITVLLAAGRRQASANIFP